MDDSLEAIKRDAERDNQENKPPFFKDVTAWLAEPDKPKKPIIKRLLKEGEALLLYGESKAGKSYLALQKGICIAAGIPFLGYETVRHRVCIYNAEVAECDYKDRVRKMLDRLNISPREVEGYLTFHHQKGEDADFDMLRGVCKEEGAEVLIADALYQIEDFDENNQKECGAIIKKLKRYKECGEKDEAGDAKGIAVIVVHHTSKGFGGDKKGVHAASGSGKLTRFPETLVHFVHQAENEDARIIDITLRIGKEKPFVVVFNDGIFERAEGLAPTPETSASHMAKNANKGANKVTEQAIKDAVFAEIEEVRNIPNYDGLGSQKTNFLTNVKARIDDDGTQIALTRLRASVAKLVQKGEIEEFRTKGRSAVVRIGERGIVQKWEGMKN